MNDCIIRPARHADQVAAYYVCLKTGDFGKDGEPFYREDPDALGRIFVGPFLAYEPELGLILEDGEGVCGYALGAFDSRAFYARYEKEWRPDLCRRFPAPQGEPSRWTRVQTVYHWYHHPDYFTPEPYEAYPSHLHIDLLVRAQGRGPGRPPLAGRREGGRLPGPLAAGPRDGQPAARRASRGGPASDRRGGGNLVA